MDSFSPSLALNHQIKSGHCLLFCRIQAKIDKLYLLGSSVHLSTVSDSKAAKLFYTNINLTHETKTAHLGCFFQLFEVREKNAPLRKEPCI